jgi:hypothetical protein
LLDRFDGGADFAVMTSDDQAIALELRSSPWSDQERHVRAALDELAAKKSAQATGTKHKKSHCPSNGVSSRSGSWA